MRQKDSNWEWQQNEQSSGRINASFQGGVLHPPEVSWEETILRLHDRSEVSYKGKLLQGGS